MALEVAAPSTPQNAELTDSELRLALGLARMRPAGQSPLALETGEFLAPASEPYDERDVESLFRKGLLAVSPHPELKNEWLAAITTLSNPLWDLSIILAAQGEMNYDRYYAGGPLHETSLIFYRAGTGGKPHHVSFPYGPSYIMGLLDQTLGFATPAIAYDSGTELNYKEYLILLSCVDVLRARALESMLRREADPANVLKLDDVRDAMQEGLEISDARWLVSIGSMVSPFEFGAADEATESLLESLQMRGYLEKDESDWIAAPKLLTMLDSLLVVPSFAAFELTFIKAPEVFEINYFAAVRGTDTIWLFDFYELATSFPRVSVATVGGDELSEMLAGLVEESRQKSEAALKARRVPDAAREGSRLPSPPTLRGLKVPPTVRRQILAAVEGRPVEAAPEPTPVPDAHPPQKAEPVESKVAEKPVSIPAERPCPSCGLPVVVGKKFCRHCGQEMVAPEALQPPAVSAPPRLVEPAPPPRVESTPPSAPRVGPAPAADALGWLRGPGPGMQPASAQPEGAPTAAPSAPFPPGPVAPGLPTPAWGAAAQQPDSAPPAFAPPPPAAPPPSPDPFRSAPFSPPAPPPPAPDRCGQASPVAPVPPSPSVQICSVCGLPVPVAAKFCGHCGANVAALRERTCPACKGRLAPNARFCAFCGNSVT